MNGVYQNTARNSLGSVVSAQITVVDADSGDLVELFNDRDGESALTNPFSSGQNGFYRFYTQPSRVNIQVVSGTAQQILQDVIILDEAPT